MTLLLCLLSLALGALWGRAIGFREAHRLWLCHRDECTDRCECERMDRTEFGADE